MESTGDRYSVGFVNGETKRTSAYRFETISDVLDASEPELAAGMTAIIKDHTGGRCMLAVRIVHEKHCHE